MPKRRFQHQKTRQDKNQIQPKQADNTRRSFFRRPLSLILPLFGIGCLGVLFGIAQGPGVLFGVVLVGTVGLGLLVRMIMGLCNIDWNNVNWEVVGAGCLGALLEGCLEVLSLEFLEHGCCLWAVILITMTGTIGGLLIGHTSLLGVLTGAGMALAIVILFVGLAFMSRNEEVFDGSNTKASVGNPADSA